VHLRVADLLADLTLRELVQAAERDDAPLQL
jgi:hypothetical protein